MKGYRFYLEFSSRKDRKLRLGDNIKEKSIEKCIAVCVKNNGRFIYLPNEDNIVKCFYGVTTHPNSECRRGTVYRSYLKNYCRRVKETIARGIHPKLFKSLK